MLQLTAPEPSGSPRDCGGSRRLTRRLRLPTPALQLLHLRTLPAFPDGFFISHRDDRIAAGIDSFIHKYWRGAV